MVTGSDSVLAAALERVAGDEGDPPVDDLLVALAGARPCTGFEMACALGAAVPGLLDEREGCLYPALASLVREGRLAARWVASNGGPARRVYAPPGAEGSDGDGEAGAHGGSAPPAGPRLRRAAEAATRSVPDAFGREEARAEVLSHLAASAARRGEEGLSPAAAERAAVNDLGDPWRIRTELRRVHLGKAALVFPRTAGERMRALLVYDLAPLLLVLGVLLLVRWQVLQPYNIPTKSMEPTLHGDYDDPDFILVDKTAYLRRSIQRWEIAVFLPPSRADSSTGDDESRQPYVKRCVGLGGETLEFRGGDVWIDGALARRDLRVEDAMMVPLYDMGGDLREASSRARLGPLAAAVFDSSWGVKAGDWVIRGDRFVGAAAGEEEARLAYLDKTTNSYIGADGRRAEFFADAGDLEVRFVAEALAPDAVFAAELAEGETRHRVVIGSRGVEVRSGEWTRSTTRGRLAAGRPVEVRFRNVDDRLTVRVDGEVVLREEPPVRVSAPRDPEPGGVALIVERGRAAFSGVRIHRDIVYLASERDAWRHQVPAGHLFMLGDNTGSSRDSRTWGSVDAVDLIGRPFLVAWPPSRARGVR